MKIETIHTLGDLKQSGYVSKRIKDELRHNLRLKIQTGKPVFEGVHGFENSVIPELERAILSRHNINLLGLRGQAKTRLARKMIELLEQVNSGKKTIDSVEFNLGKELAEKFIYPALKK